MEARFRPLTRRLSRKGLLLCGEALRDLLRVYSSNSQCDRQRVFSRCAASFFLEIRQYSCKKMSCSTQKFLAAGHIGSWKNTPYDSKTRRASARRVVHFIRERRFRRFPCACRASAGHGYAPASCRSSRRSATHRPARGAPRPPQTAAHPSDRPPRRALS